MATISDIPGMLGDYMLKGWVLTDQTCPTPGCPVPLMRSPSGRMPMTTFCVSCNPNHHISSTLPAAPSDVSSDSHASRSSTPPTEISEIPGSPIFAPPPETDQTRRRREQSDRASSEIGKKLLQGWAMLGEECPNSACYGVPLVRPPRAGGEKDSRKECVICGNSYVTKTDLEGGEILVAASSNNVQPTTIIPTSTGHPSDSVSNVLEGKSAAVAAQAITHDIVQSSVPTQAMAPPTLTATIVDQSSQALQDSLRALSGRLTSLSSRAVMDPNAIGSTADAIGKVIQALTQARQLQWAEKQAYGPGPF